MASITKDPSSGCYYIRFRHEGVSYKRSLATKNRGEAKAAKIRVLDTIKDIKRGRLQIPDGAEPGLFILTDGKVVEQPCY